MENSKDLGYHSIGSPMPHHACIKICMPMGNGTLFTGYINLTLAHRECLILSARIVLHFLVSHVQWMCAYYCLYLNKDSLFPKGKKRGINI